VRPRPTAPVAVPLHWEELSDKSLRPDGWTVANVGARLEAGDPWEGMSRRARAFPRRN
jgi:DNA primase